MPSKQAANTDPVIFAMMRRYEKACDEKLRQYRAALNGFPKDFDLDAFMRDHDVRWLTSSSFLCPRCLVAIIHH
jgi:hypothetical protein